MAAKNNLTMTSDVQVTAREIDFVTRFARNWQHLRDILGIMRPIKKQPGTVLKSKTASVTLAQSVGEGEEDVFVLYPESSFFRASGETPRRVSSSLTSLALMPGLRRARSWSVNSGSITISLTRLLM